LGIKVEVSDFEGVVHLDEFIGWLHTIECVSDLKNIPKGGKVKLVAIKLKKYAFIWWENVKRQ